MSDEPFREIPLTRGKVARVDPADYEYLSQFNWQAIRPWKKKAGTEVWYARRAVGPRSAGKVMMHLEIAGASRGVTVDHRDGDGLNNCRSNLRVATPAQQNANFVHKRAGTTSRFKGVSWYKAYGRWRAQIQVDGRNRALGYFDDEEEAARAYDAAAKEAFKDFASTNFPT